MSRFIPRLVCATILLGGLSLVAVENPANAQAAAQSEESRFAAGVVTTIEPDIDPEDTVGKHDVIELLADKSLQRKPNYDTESRTLYEMAKDVRYRRDVWCLELSFKPLRMVYVDVPQPSGRMQRKLIWYMVYRVRNTGATLGPEEQADGSFKTGEVAPEPHRFVPQFILTSRDRDAQGKPIRKAYLDRVLPAAVPVIEEREFSGNSLLNSAEISESLLAVESGRSVGGLWGVAIWEDVDPSIDFLSVYVNGLTNAYRWKDNPEAFQAGDSFGKGRRFFRKMLQLNFWRPGDTLAENEREIRFGVAPGYAEYYGTGEGVAYRWVYR